MSLDDLLRLRSLGRTALEDASASSLLGFNHGNDFDALLLDDVSVLANAPTIPGPAAAPTGRRREGASRLGWTVHCPSVRRRAIAVAGMSGSGKTTLAESLAQELGASLLRTDDYYRPLDHLTYAERCEVNFDHPDAVDGTRLARDLGRLLAGEAIEVAEYDFCRHTGGRTRRRVAAGEFVVVEGIFALAYPEVAALCDVRVFVDASEDACLQRRIARDVAERGRTPGEVVSRFTGHVAPMFRRHVLPHRDRATVCVGGERCRRGEVETVLREVGLSRVA